MSKIILKYVEGKFDNENYGRSIEYYSFIGTPQLRENGDIVIVTSLSTRDKILKD
jgi:hypothetical protein